MSVILRIVIPLDPITFGEIFEIFFIGIVWGNSINISQFINHSVNYENIISSSCKEFHQGLLYKRRISRNLDIINYAYLIFNL